METDLQPSGIASRATAANPEDLERLYTFLGDQEWRLNNLYWIQDKEGEKIKFRMNAVQRHAFENRWHRLIEPKSRQHGLSTWWAIYALDMCLFNPNKTAGIIDRTDDEGKKKLAKMKFAYDHLDDPDDPSTCLLGQMIKAAVPLVKGSASELKFANDSSAWTSVSSRGGTLQFLHVSELGPIAYYDARRAEEIKSGAFPSVPDTGMIVVESTHKGGRSGMLFEMIDKARNAPAEMTSKDWKLYFYGWHLDPRNTMDPDRFPYWEPSEEEREYFESLKKSGIKLSKGQQLWWSRTKQEQGDFMSTEYPATIEEMLDSVIKGAVYGTILNKLREDKRLVEFPVDSTAPLYTSWDLGGSDLTCIWLWQFVGPYPRIVDYYASRMAHPSKYVQKVQDWEFMYRTTVGANFLPHDGAPAKGSSAPSWMEELTRCGLKNIVVVPKTSDVWIDINNTRRLLAMCMINPVTCGRPLGEVEGVKIPSGLESLECYHVEAIQEGRSVRETPVHDIHSHGADALRTMGAAMARGMVKGHSAVEKTFRNRQADIPGGVHPLARETQRVVANVHGGRGRRNAYRIRY